MVNVTPVTSGGVSVQPPVSPYLQPSQLAAGGTDGQVLTNNGDDTYDWDDLPTSVSGNAGTATKLQTSRTINGVGFDGTANVLIDSVYAYIATNHGVVGNGTTDDTTAINALLTLARTNKIPVYFPRLTYKITATVDMRGDGLQVYGGTEFGTVFKMATANTVAVQVGYTHQTIRDIQVQYATAPAGTDTSAIAYQAYKPFKCDYKLGAYQVGFGWRLFQGDVNTPLGDNGGNYCSSNDIELTIQNYYVTAVDTTAYNRANSGNRWGNVYCQISGAISPAGYGVKLVNNDNDAWSQLNIEGGSWTSANGPLFSQGSNVTINSLHMEGFTLSTYGKSLVTVDSQGCLVITSWKVQGATINSGGGDNKGLVGLTGGAHCIVDGFAFGNANTFGSGLNLGILDAIDQSGKFWIKGIDATTLTHFTALTYDDTGSTPVCKQINERLLHWVDANGKNHMSGTAAPTTGTWAVGDYVYNAAPAVSGTSTLIGWTCTSAGTPGTWTAEYTTTSQSSQLFSSKLRRSVLAPGAPYPRVLTTVPTITITGDASNLSGLVTTGGLLSPRANQIQPAQIGTWTASTSYSQGKAVVTPDGLTQIRINAGTSRSTYDATEIALWMPVGNIATFHNGGYFNNQNGSNGWTAGYIGGGFARNPFSLSTMYGGIKMGLRFTSAPGGNYRVRVNGQAVTSWTPVNGPGDGGDHFLGVDFTSTVLSGVQKLVTFDVQDCDMKLFYGLATDTFRPFTPNGPKTIVCGDSYGGGSTDFGGTNSWVMSFADAMGWQDVWNSSIGGSGYLNGTSLIGRYVADVINQAPDQVIIPLGHNDQGSSTGAQITTAVTTIVAAIRAALPNCIVVIVGPFFTGDSVSGGPSATWAPVQAAITAGAQAGGAHMIIDTVNGPKIFTGTGHVGATTGVGNSDFYINAADTTHPSLAGCDFLGQNWMTNQYLAQLQAA